MMFKTSMRHGDEILLSITKIPPDDLLDSLYKMRIRESEKLMTVSELYDLEIHQKNRTWLSQIENYGENISMPDYQQVKTMV